MDVAEKYAVPLQDAAGAVIFKVMTLARILALLLEKEEAGRRTIENVRTVVSEYESLAGNDGAVFSAHPIIHLSVRRAARTHPVTYKYEEFYDLDLLLKAQEAFEPATVIGKRQKAETLFMAATGSRSSDAARLHFGTLRHLEGGGLQYQLRGPKESRGQYKFSAPQRLDPFPERPGVCPVRAIETYLQVTAAARDALTPEQREKAAMVFLTTTAVPRDMAPGTVGNDVKRSLTDAGIDVTKYQSHSVRGAAMTKGIKAGILPDDLMARARISSTSTFWTYYARAAPQDRTTSLILRSLG